MVDRTHLPDLHVSDIIIGYSVIIVLFVLFEKQEQHVSNFFLILPFVWFLFYEVLRQFLKYAASVAWILFVYSIYELSVGLRVALLSPEKITHDFSRDLQFKIFLIVSFGLVIWTRRGEIFENLSIKGDRDFIISIITIPVFNVYLAIVIYEINGLDFPYPLNLIMMVLCSTLVLLILGYAFSFYFFKEDGTLFMVGSIFGAFVFMEFFDLFELPEPWFYVYIISIALMITIFTFSQRFFHNRGHREELN